jgi:radical SAM superfamily enzyme YgiQ (UPF0313 family)
VHLLFIFKEIDNEPHGVLHISSYVKRLGGHRTSMVVATEEDPLEAAQRLKPDVVAYSLYSGSQRYYLEINRQIKAALPRVFSLFGGYHPTYYPQMVEEPGVDAICLGEGEAATLDLLNALQRGEPIERIPNLHFNFGGRIVRNPVRPMESDLDRLPFADRELLYQAYPQAAESKIKPFIAGRGCPYDCSFCFNRAFYELYGSGRKVRWRSPDEVIREIVQVRSRYPLSFLLFMDDTFVLNPKWLAEFSAKYKAHVGLPFWCQVRADLVVKKPETVKMLADAGCASVSFGLETANDRLRNSILSRNMSKEEIVQASRILREHGIAVMTNNMLGLPTGSLEADLETLELNIRCKPSYANVFLFQPYPGTELGRMAYENGWTMGSPDKLPGSHTRTTIVKFGSESEKRQIENLQKLFAVTVEFPRLLPLTRLLIKLPANRLYWLIYKLWKGWAIKRRMFPYRLTPKEYAREALRYMHITSQ